jgi:hypothetical protein
LNRDVCKATRLTHESHQRLDNDSVAIEIKRNIETDIADDVPWVAIDRIDNQEWIEG